MREMQIVERGSTIFIEYQEKKKKRNLYIPAVLERGTAASNKVLQEREHRLNLPPHDRQNQNNFTSNRGGELSGAP